MNLFVFLRKYGFWLKSFNDACILVLLDVLDYLICLFFTGKLFI
jgi:hypothetical protein